MIKVYKRTGFTLSDDEVDIATAIQYSCDEIPYGYGEIEGLKNTCFEQSRIIGKLVSILVKKELMTADELDEMLSYSYGASE